MTDSFYVAWRYLRFNWGRSVTLVACVTLIAVLPLALEDGDRIRILCCGAYTTSYSSVGFNGFPPLEAIYV